MVFFWEGRASERGIEFSGDLATTAAAPPLAGLADLPAVGGAGSGTSPGLLLRERKGGGGDGQKKRRGDQPPPPDRRPTSSEFQSL